MMYETHYCSDCHFTFAWWENTEDIRCSYCEKDCVKIPEEMKSAFSRISLQIGNYQTLSMILEKVNQSILVMGDARYKNDSLISYFDKEQEGFRMMMNGFLTNLTS